MSRFPLGHRSTCGSAEQTFVLIGAVRITFWPLVGRNSQFAQPKTSFDLSKGKI